MDSAQVDLLLGMDGWGEHPYFRLPKSFVLPLLKILECLQNGCRDAIGHDGVESVQCNAFLIISFLQTHLSPFAR